MDVYYTRDDDWIAVDGGIATIGITDHAQKQLGDILFVEGPPPGRRIERGQEAVLVESIKVAADIYAPVSGTVIETNPALRTRPSLVNTSPEGEGWMFRMAMSDMAELTGLLRRDAYLARVRLL